MSKLSGITIKDITNHHKYKIEDLFVYSPYEIYQSQETFMTYVIQCLNRKQNALIQSPTGTGKTISLLCSTISWVVQQQKRNPQQPPPQIIYASRTHSQLKQVVKELNSLCYKLKMAVLGSRDQTCINEDLKLLRGQDKELECRLRVAQKRGMSCKFYKSQSHNENVVGLGHIMDIQEISVRGKLECFCPYFYEKQSAITANLVLMPYNYLFDQRQLSQQGLKLEGSIIILDEAHNIQSVCEQSREYSITLSTLTRAVHQAADLRELKLMENKGRLDPSQNDKIKMMRITPQDVQINASYMNLIHSHLQTIDIPSGPSGLLQSTEEFRRMIDEVTEASDFGHLSGNISQLIKGFDSFRADLMFTPSWALQSWMKFVERLREIESASKQQKHSQFTVQIAYEGADICVRIHCLDPSIAFRKVMAEHRPRSIILTSGTLSPLKAWPLELGVDFAQPVSCPHVLSQDQVNTLVLGVGPSGSPIDTKFESRKNPRLYDDFGQILLDIVRYTPNGVVVLFPSYGVLEQTKNHLTSQKVLTKLYECKSIYIQRKQNSDFASMIDRFMKDAQTNKGALLMAIVRGRVSEGLDFAHDKCRAVVLFGVPYPCSKDVKVTSKMSYFDAKKGEGASLNGSQWYLAETVRAINQGIGRLIRSPADYGTVYLLDSRFSKQDIESQLASWARMSLFKYSNYGDFLSKVKKINKVEENMQMKVIQSEMGFVSHRGTIIGPDMTLQPPKTIKGSISALPSKNMGALNNKNSSLTLPQLMADIKANKRESPQKNEVDLTELEEKQNKSRNDYEKKLFARPKPKPVVLEGTISMCPVCQTEAIMVKSNTCLHSLCQDCWDKWLDQDLRCPICRGRVRKNFLIPQA